MNKSPREDLSQASSNPWKIGVFATVGATVLLVAAGLTLAAFNRSETAQTPAAPPSAAAPRGEVAAATAAPAPQTQVRSRENCEQYRVDTTRDSTRIAKDGAVGAMIGAGTGAAGGAIVDGGSGAGKGAGIGAVVGAVAGAIHGLTEENARVGDAESAYSDCLARNG